MFLTDELGFKKEKVTRGHTRPQKFIFFFLFPHNQKHETNKKMGTPQENFDQGVAFRMTGNEAFKKQDYKKGKKESLYSEQVSFTLKTNNIL